MSSQARHWLFTVNNPQGLDDELPLDSDYRYLVYQVEQGQTVHLQGYVEFAKPMRFSALKKLCPRAHWEQRMGTREEARAYCMKEDSRLDGPYEFGEWTTKGQGRRSDLLEVKKLIDAGASMKEIADFSFGSYVRYHNGLAKYRLLTQTVRTWKTHVTLVIGDPGFGKTTWVTRQVEADPGGVYWKPPCCHWWDNYQGETTVVFDDHNTAWLKRDLLLRVMDVGPLTMEFKGGAANYCARNLWITANREPIHWYRPELGPVMALTRRIDRVVWFTDYLEWVEFGTYLSYYRSRYGVDPPGIVDLQAPPEVLSQDTLPNEDAMGTP